MEAVSPRVERPAPYVVGIGASAGGLEALEAFFDNVPKPSGMAFVVIQHLSPDFKSLMDELLARHTELPIHLVEDGMVVEADHVYLIPPKKEMIISGGRLLLSERDRQQELTLPIDVFFRSLAQDCGPRAVAIVLSGGGSDGSRGIRDVHEAGGLVIVQDIESAQFDGMPKTARDAGVATFVLAPQEMPHVLVEHVRTNGANGTAPRKAHTSSGQGIDVVYDMLQGEFGIDFTHYKPSTVTRRIERRLQLSRVSDIDEYVERLRRGRDELDVLYRDLLIGVTRFFRNEEAFDVLEHKVLPDLLKKGPRDAPLRVWVAGCATGEEAYSLAIILAELSAQHGGRPVKIFATDVHRGSIESASRAIYGEEAIANVSPQRRDRWFLPRAGGYQVVPEIRQMVVFAAHNVIKDAPFTRMDLISCRNLLIYLQPPAQQKVLSLFHFSLNKGGVCFLGPSESPGALFHDFEALERHWRIYRKYSDVRIPVDPRFQPVRHEMRVAPPTTQPTRYSIAGLLATYDTLLDEVMPPSLLVSDKGELIHAFAGASKFLELRDGRQDLDVLDIVGSELRMVLVGGLSRAKKETNAIVFNGVRIRVEGNEAFYKVTVRRVKGRSGAHSHVLVSFEPSNAVPRALGSSPNETEIDLAHVSREQLAALESELSYTKENLQAAIEELETSNEELQAANEELLASNEELQSTNEELQSVNEELYTVNAEYQRKIGELTEMTNDMDNLLSSTDVGTIFLDRELNIRRFTPQIADSFTLLPQDIGRPIETFTHKMDYVELVDDLRRVVADGKPIEREARDRLGRAFFLRLLPYRAKGDVLGVVITLIDVSGLKAAEDALFHERHLLNSLLTSIPDAIYFKDARGRIIRANHAMAARLELSDPRDAVGKTAFELPNRHVALAIQQHDDVVLRTGEAQPYRLERRPRSDGRDGPPSWDLVTRLPLRDHAQRTVGIIGVFRDVTEQKRAEERIQDAMQRRDEFLAMLSHELRNPLGAVVTAAALLKTAGCPIEERPRLMDIIERQSQQMARLLDDLLEVSRVTQNKIELRKKRIDLGVVTREAADAVRSLMDRRRIEFTVAIDPTPLPVLGDPARLQQVQVNLLTNASKYTHRGGRVRLEARQEGAEAVVVVRDDGAGIPPEMLENVFELFVQSNRTLDRAEGGLGVGLTLVRSLVAMHGGRVTAESGGEGKGSEFTVRLPLALGAGLEDEAVNSEERVRILGARRPAGRRIAIIEDNEDSREMLCELLVRSGFDCSSTGRGDDGLALIRETRPDIALVDLGLPGIDGLELARRVRADASVAKTFLVALTGYGQATDRLTAMNAGFDEHVVKPVRVDELLRVLVADGLPAPLSITSDSSAE